jgi:hypothetical protein
LNQSSKPSTNPDKDKTHPGIDNRAITSRQTEQPKHRVIGGRLEREQKTA